MDDDDDDDDESDDDDDDGDSLALRDAEAISIRAYVAVCAETSVAKEKDDVSLGTHA